LFLNGTLVAEHADTPRTPSADFEHGTGFVGNIDEVSVFTVPQADLNRFDRSGWLGSSGAASPRR
jgi:hypothetical protein